MKVLAISDDKGTNMVDWNNDGQIGADDLILTDIILDDEVKGGGGNKPNGSCLSSLLLLIIPPVVLIATLCNLIN